MNKQTTKQLGRLTGKIFIAGSKAMVFSALGVTIMAIFVEKKNPKELSLKDWVDRL